MGGKTITISRTEIADDIEVAFNDANKLLRAIKQSPASASASDFKKAREAMAKGKPKTPLCYRATISADLKSLELAGTVDGKVVHHLTAINLAAVGSQKEWREALVGLSGFKVKDGVLVTDADLKAWDAKHPDPAKVAALRTQLDNLTKELTAINILIKRYQDQAKPKIEAAEKIRKELKRLGE